MKAGHLARLCALMLALGVGHAFSQSSQDADERDAEETMLRRSFSQASDEQWRERMMQDAVQAWCSRYRNQPPEDVQARIRGTQSASIRYPADGRLLGDWRQGERLAMTGTGGHIGRIQPDPPDRKRGGNCYACHRLAPQEVAAGTIGPSLTGYGKSRGRSAEVVKYTYDKIYDAQASVACSLMPRFGHSGWLTPEEIAHAVAFLLDAESPVNK